jgi:hypothetical protein
MENNLEMCLDLWGAAGELREARSGKGVDPSE